MVAMYCLTDLLQSGHCKLIRKCWAEQVHIFFYETVGNHFLENFRFLGFHWIIDCGIYSFVLIE